MPRKDDLLKKQKRLIATRLMQISLFVDDYLYQNKSMSQNSASFYIKEISGYKDKCDRDVRSLQVIEKLTRCLKGIIQEQQELNGQDFENVFEVLSQHIPESNIIQSPVYSTIEDLTQYEEDMNIRIHEQIQGTHVNEDNVEVNDSRKDVTTENDPFCDTNKVVETDMPKSAEGNSNNINFNEKYPLNTDLEVIDLCDDEIEELIKQNRTLIEPDFNIQNAISHLSITDIEEALTPISQVCSQSILNSYFTVGQENSVKPLTVYYEDTITVTTHHKPATDKTCDKITKIALPKKIATEQNMPEELAIQNIYQHIEEVPTKKSAKVLKPAPKKYLRNNDTNSKGATAKAKIKLTKIAAKPAQKKKAKVVKQTLHVERTINLQSNNKNPLTFSKPLDTETTGSNIQRKIKDIPIYNNAIVNDLSWIENIRFVREIQSEEYESLAEHEIFWENYTLPNNWSENDFNY